MAETLVGIVTPMVYREAVALIAEHHDAGRDVVVVSTSGAELVEPIAAMLGADDVIATRMVERDGRYTGEIAFYAYGPNKAAAIRELAARRGYDLAQSHAYSDSATDLPMLEAVGHPHAVNPDRALRREAARARLARARLRPPRAAAPPARRPPGPRAAAPAGNVVPAVAVAGALAVTAVLTWHVAGGRSPSPRRPCGTIPGTAPIEAGRSRRRRRRARPLRCRRPRPSRRARATRPTLGAPLPVAGEGQRDGGPAARAAPPPTRPRLSGPVRARRRPPGTPRAPRRRSR